MRVKTSIIKLLAAVATSVAFSVTAVSGAAVAQDSVVVPGEVLAENCPVGFQYSTGIMVNATTHEVFTVCNSPLNEADLLLRQQDQDFMDAIRAAQQVAEDQSRVWNEAHPGQQRCVQWGPIVHANGVSTSSGGVCANPVAAPAQPSVEVRTDSAPSVDVRTDPAPSVDVRIDAPAPEPSPTPAPAPVAPPAPSGPSGIGGWAMVNDANQNLGTTVCDVSVCGTPGSDFLNAYHRDHPEIRFVYFAPAEPSGNVAGWSGGTYDPGSDTFWLNGCSHVGGAPVSLVTCPPSPPAPTTSTSPSAVTRTSEVRVPTDSSVQVRTESPNPATSLPVDVSNQDSLSGGTPVAGSVPAPIVPSTIEEPLPAPLPAPVETTSARPDAATTIVLGEVTQAQQTNVAIASLIKSAVALPMATTSGSVKLAVSNVKITSRSLTPKVCSVTSKGVKQLGYGKCKVELSVTLADGSKVSTTKAIAFRKKA